MPGLARFRRGTDIPLATGEHEYTKYGVRDLLLHEAAAAPPINETTRRRCMSMLFPPFSDVPA